MKGDGWRPIESAPKDNKGRILLLLKSGRVVTGKGWFSVLMGPEKPGGGRETVGAKFAGYCEEESGAVVPRSPTHWMPMPAPPENADGR